MASSEQLAAFEPWMFRTALADSWISEAFARDTDTLTKALQKSLSDNLSADSVSPYLTPETLSSAAQTLSGSGSDLETVAPKRRNAAAGTTSGRIIKRKSRASKRNTTTFITADPANFRQMVQEVTGVRFVNGQMPVYGPVLKPEPQRASFTRLQGCLPTLDTSAFLLNHHNQQVVGPSSTTAIAQPLQVVSDGGSGFDFESFSSFPTLESWK